MFSVEELNAVMRMDLPRNRVIPWSVYHLYHAELNEFDRANIDLMNGYKDYLKAYAEAGHAYTVVCDGVITAQFGIFQLWPGNCEMWLMPSPEISKKTVALHRASLAFFEHAAAKMGTKRLQFTVHSANVRADRWAQRCYFQKEGLLRHYGPDGSDYHMYARYFDG